MLQIKLNKWMILTFVLITIHKHHSGIAEIIMPTEYVSVVNKFCESLHTIAIEII